MLRCAGRRRDINNLRCYAVSFVAVKRMIKNAVVLAGGRGVRLIPLTLRTPKPLLPVGNTPMLDHIISSLARSGFDRIIVAVNYLGWKILAHLLQRWSESGLEIIAPSIQPEDTADAVRKLRDHIDGDFIVAMGDVITNMKLREFANAHEKWGGIASVALVEVPSLKDFGAVIIDKGGRILHFIEKPRHEEVYVVSLAYCDPARLHMPYRNLANSGFYAFRYDILDILDDNPHLMDFGKHVFPWLLESGYEVRGWEAADAYWIDVGRHSTYLLANFDLLLGSASPLKPYGVEHGGVWLGEDVDISEGARVLPPSAIGDNVEIGSGATVGPFAVLGHGARVEKDSRISYSVLLDGSSVSESSVIYQSILGKNVYVSPSCALERAVVGDNEVVSGRIRASLEPIIYEKMKFDGVKA